MERRKRRGGKWREKERKEEKKKINYLKAFNALRVFFHEICYSTSRSRSISR
jgi:hypothetical protein